MAAVYKKKKADTIPTQEDYIENSQKATEEVDTWDGIKYLGGKVGAGFMQTIEGAVDYVSAAALRLGGDERRAKEVLDNDWFGDFYTRHDENFNPQGGWKVAGDVAQGIGTSLPSIAITLAGVAIAALGAAAAPVSGGTSTAGVAAGAGVAAKGVASAVMAGAKIAGAVGAAVSGLGAAGTGTKEAYQETGELGGKEFGYGAAQGITEAGLELVGNKIGAGTGVIYKSLTKNAAKVVAKKSVVKTLASGFVGEAFEEGMSEFLSPYYKRMTYNPEAQNASAADIAYAAFVGGATGALFGGASVVSDPVKNIVSGNRIVNKGETSQVLYAAEEIIGEESGIPLAKKDREIIRKQYDKIGITSETAQGATLSQKQKIALAELNEMTVAASVQSFTISAAKDIVENAEAYVENLNRLGYTDANGNAMSFTPESLRKGLEGISNISNDDIITALKNNPSLRMVAVASVAGNMSIDADRATTAMAEEGFTGMTAVDIDRYLAKASPDQVAAVEQILGVDLRKTPVEEVNARAKLYKELGGTGELRRRTAIVSALKAIPESKARKIPKAIAIADGHVARYKAENANIGVKREGDTYTLYDYDSGYVTKGLTRSEVNKALAKYAAETAKKETAQKTKRVVGKDSASVPTEHTSIKEAMAKEGLNKVQRASLRALQRVADAIGVNIRIYESPLVEKVDKNGNVVKDKNGKTVMVRDGANGMYDPNTDTIYIDLYASVDGKGTMLFTASHELTHFIKAWNLEQFNNFKAFLEKHYLKSGQSFNALARMKMAEARARGDSLSFDVATEEVVADACESMLADPDIVSKLTAEEGKNKSLVAKIKDFLKRWYNKIVNVYRRLSPDSYEGKYTAAMEEVFAKAKEMWVDLVKGAKANFDAAEIVTTESLRGEQDGVVIKNEVTDFLIDKKEVLSSVRTERTALPKQTMSVSTGEGTILDSVGDIKPTEVKGVGGNAVKGFTGRAVRGWAMEANGYAVKQINAVNTFMDTMAEFMEKAGATYKFIGLQDVENAQLHYRYKADGSIESIVLSAMVKNGDYPVNFDLSSICKKRETMSKLMDKLAKRGSLDNGTVDLSPTSIFMINKALKDAGVETACLGCFVEAKRYNSIKWAESFCKKWNAAVKKVNRDATYFGFGDDSFTEDAFTVEQAKKIDEAATKYIVTGKKERLANALAKYTARQAEGKPLVEGNLMKVDGKELNTFSKAARERIEKSDTISDILKEKYLTMDVSKLKISDVTFLLENGVLPGVSLSNKQAATEMVKSGEAYQHLLRPSDLLTDRGIRRLTALPNFKGVLYGHYGSGTPKLMQSYTPYNSEIALLTGKGKEGLAEYLYSIAGVRMQSFSDFQIQNVFDYLQMIGDLAAKKLPAHAYTKEISFARLLGMTGIKVNLSVMFDIDPTVDSDHAGLVKYNPLVHKGEYAKIVLEDSKGKWVYNVGDYFTQRMFAEAYPNEAKRFLQSSGFADAVKLQSTEGYSANCGIIGVGYSDLAIIAMLDDNRIRYIIPYHASALPADIKVATHIELGTDYTSTQNTMKVAEITDKDGKKVDWSVKEAYKRLKSGQAVMDELNGHVKNDGWVVKTTKAQNGHGTYGLYEDLMKTNEPRQTARNFMDWCAANGTLPLFYQFASHENYYKLLYDFNVYDCITEKYAPQQAVSNTYPTMVDGSVKAADVAEGEFNAEYFTSLIDNQMSFMESYGRDLDSTLDRLASNMESGNYSLEEKTVENGKLVRDVLKSERTKKDSEGNALSAEQQEFFKGSKVRDAEGRLTPVYHGTPSGGFTEFQLPFYLKTLTSAQGAGFYFTDKANASQYMRGLNGKSVSKKQLYKVYLNITNPLEISEYSKGAISDEVFRRIMARGNYEWGMAHTDIDKILQYATLDSDRLAEMVRVFNGEEILTVMKEELGHDGVRFTDKYGDVWVAWDKAQIKNTSNKTPTSDPDIRFSNRSKNAVDNGRKEVYNSKRKVRSYIHPSRIDPSDYRSLRSQLKNLYAGEDGIADDLALVVGNTIYYTDSGMDEGNLSFGVYKIINAPDDYDVQDAVRRLNYESWRESKFSRQVSDSLGLQHGDDTTSNRPERAGQELRGDQKQSEHHQGGVLGADGDRGVRLQVKNSPRIQRAIESFGTTADYNVAGFVLEDGRMLKLGQSGVGVNHKKIEAVYDDAKGSAAVNRFIQEGNVRVKASSPGIEISDKTPVTVRQLNALSRFISGSLRSKGVFYLDVTDESGKDVASKTYYEDSTTSEVVEDIKDYYRTGKLKETMFSNRYKYSTEGMTDEEIAAANSVIKRLSDMRLVGRYGVRHTASYTDERIEDEIKDSSSKDVIDYAKSYIAWVTPDDFIYATTMTEQSRERLKQEAGTLDVERLKEQKQPIYLKVDFYSGEIVGHEGRHRMLALKDAGIERVAVIIDAIEDDRHHTKPIDIKHLGGQKFGYSKGLGFYIHDMLPLSKRYADVAREMFSFDSDTGVRFSARPKQGQVQKRIAEISEERVYSKKGAMELAKRITLGSNLTMKSLDDIANSIWGYLNTEQSSEDRYGKAYELADIIVERMLSEGKVGNPEVDEARERLAKMRTAIGRITFDEKAKSELKHILDKDGYKSFLSRWGYKKSKGTPYSMYQFVVDFARETDGMQHLENANEVDAMVEIDKIYDRVKKEADEAYIDFIDTVPSREIEMMKSDVADEIYAAFSDDEMSSRSAISLVAERYYARMNYWKASYDMLKGREPILNITKNIEYVAEKIRNIKLGKYKNVTDDTMKVFNDSILKLGKVTYRGRMSRPTSVKKTFEELRKWYKADNGMLGGEGNSLFDQEVADRIDYIATVDKRAYDIDDLRAIDYVMRYMARFLERWRKVYRNGKWVDADEVAEDFVKKINDAELIRKRAFIGNIARKYNESFGDPMSVARRMDMYEDGFFTQMMEKLRRGAVDAEVAKMNVLRRYDAFLKEHSDYLIKAGNEKVKYRNSVMSKLQLISLYMSYKRRQAMPGLVYAGFAYDVIENGRTKRVQVPPIAERPLVTSVDELYADAELHAKAQEKVLEEKLSDLDRQYIGILEQAFNHDLKQIKMLRDIDRTGVSNVSDGYYFPIRREPIPVNVDAKTMREELDTVSNASFNKDTVAGAAQRLFISNADSIFTRHADMVCKYAHISPVVEEYNLLYNLNLSDDQNNPFTIRDKAINAWSGGHEYFANLIKNLEGQSDTPKLGAHTIGAIRSAYAVAMLSANPKTWFTQLSSIFAAQSILDMDSIAMGVKVGSSDVDIYCPLAELRAKDNSAAKAQGVLDDSKTRSATDAVSRGIRKVGDAGMTPIGKMDRLVIRWNFGACQVQVAKNHKGDESYAVGTEKNKVEAGKLLEKVILETQQNTLMTEKSAAMRSGSEFLRTATMFSSDSMKVFGRAVDAHGEKKAIKAKLGLIKSGKIVVSDEEQVVRQLKARLKAAGKKEAKAIYALFMSAVWMSAVSEFFRHIYNKQDDSKWYERIVTGYIGNLIGGLPVIRDIYTKLFEGYDVDNYTDSAINDILAAVTSVFTALKNGDKPWASIKALAFAFSSVLGLPVRNVYNTVTGLIRRFSEPTGYAIDEAFYDKNYKTDFDKAVEEGDDRMQDYLLGLLVGERIDTTLDEDVFDEVLRLSVADFKVVPKDAPDKITVDGEEVKLTEEQRAEIRELSGKANDALAKLVKTGKYRNYSDEKKAEAVNYVFDLYRDKAIYDVTKVRRSKDTALLGVIGSNTLANLHVAQKGAKDARASTIKYVSGTSLTTGAKLLLIYANGYSVKDGEIRGVSKDKARSILANYINTLGLSTKRKQELAKMCGLTVKNGKISP